MTSNSLFRSEVLAHKSTFQDEIIIQHSRATSIYVTFIALLIFSIACIAIFGSLSRKIRVTGIVVHGNGSNTVSTPMAGMITKIHVNEGQIIKAGEPLFDISNDRNIGLGSSYNAIQKRVEHRGKALQDELKSVNEAGARRIQDIKDRLSGVQREIDTMDEEFIVTEKRLSIAKTKMERAKQLQKLGFYSPNQIEEEEVRVLEIQARLNGLTRNRQQLVTSKTSMEAEAKLSELTLRTSVAQIDGKRASLEQESIDSDTRNYVRIVSVTNGVISNLTYHVGQNVTPSQVLASITPLDSKFEVHLYAPSRTIGLLRLDQQVSIRYHAFPYQQFGRHSGKVVEIGKVPFAPTELPNYIASTVLGNAQLSRLTNTTPEGLYRIKVAIEPKFMDYKGSPLTLKQGMTLEADIHGREEKLWRWMLEPFRVAY